MKKYILSLMLFAIAFTAKGISQEDEHRKNRREEMKALQIGFITEKLDLSTDESQAFWPIYNAFEDDSRAIKGAVRKKKNISELSDQEAMDLVSAKLEADEKMLVLKRQYVEDLKPVLPAKKIAQLFTIEHEFKRKMLKNIREKRKEKHKPKKG